MDDSKGTDLDFHAFRTGFSAVFCLARPVGKKVVLCFALRGGMDFANDAAEKIETNSCGFDLGFSAVLLSPRDVVATVPLKNCSVC